MTTTTTTSVHPRMIKGRAKMITNQPFFGTLALHLELVETTTMPTMATDGRKLFYNPKFLDELTDEEVEFVIAHEALHCACLHHTRRQERDPKLWNVAADYVINLDLVKAGYKCPKGGLLDQQFDGLGAEDVYSILKQKQREKDGGEDGQSGRGSGKGKPGQPGQGGVQGHDAQMAECGEVLDGSASAAERGEQESEWETITRQAVAVATRHHGSVPAYLDRLVKELKAPKQDWREILRRFVDQATNYDYSWSKADRRFLTERFILPGVVKEGVNHLAVALDTSGSIYGCPQALERFGGELQSMLDEGVADKITVVYCDTQVQDPQEYIPGDKLDLKPKGGGGTDFAPVWKWLAEHEPDVTAVIYFTDLYGHFGECPPWPVLWAAYGDVRSIRQIQVPFGEVIELAE